MKGVHLVQLTGDQRQDVIEALADQVSATVARARLAPSEIACAALRARATRYTEALIAVAGDDSEAVCTTLLAGLRDHHILPSREGIRRD